ncbi:hypothetical protein [Arthrobacter sp. NyZ413]
MMHHNLVNAHLRDVHDLTEKWLTNIEHCFPDDAEAAKNNELI